MAKMSPERRAKLEAKRAEAQEKYLEQEIKYEEEFLKINKQKELSQQKLNDLTDRSFTMTRGLVDAAQANADVMDMQVSHAEKLVSNAQELSLLSNEGYKRQVKKEVMDAAAHKTITDSLDLEKEMELIFDDRYQQDILNQKILADKKTTSQAIAQLAIDESVKKNESLNAEKEVLRILQKQVDRSTELDESLQKFTDFKNDIFEVIQDPAVASGLFLVAWGNELNKLNERLVEMEGNMGMSRTQALELGPTMASANIQGALMGVSSELTQGAMEGMSEAMGRVGELTGAQVAQTAKLSKELGISAKETGNLVGRMMLVEGHSVESAQASLELTANLARGANVPIGKVTKDLADNMELTSKFGNISVAELGNMAVEAAKLGTSLTAISALGDKMMNVDQARNDAMELSVMLGKQVNIDKVQQLMYEGKTTEAYKEMLGQLGGISAFNDMDYFQKKRAADMMGTTTADLEKQLNLAAGLSDTGKKEASGWAKITQGAGDYFDVLKDNSGTVLASMNLFKSLGSNIGAFSSASKGATGVFGKLKSGLGGMKDKFLGKAPAVSGGGGGGDDLGAKINETADSSDQVAEGPKKGMKDKLSDLAAGLKKMGSKGVIQGIGNMALAGPAFIMALPAIPFLLFMGKVSLKSLASNFKGLGQGLKNMSKSLKGAAVMALAGPALGLATLAIPFLAFMGLMPLAMLATNFNFLGQGLKGLGKGFTSILKGLLVLGLLGVAMIPAALAFSLIEGIDPMGMLAFSVSLGILGLAAAGLGMIMPMVLMGSLALAVLGLAILPAAFAMSQLAGVDAGTILGFAVGLGILGLAVAGMGFMIIGIGLGAIAAKLLGPAIEPAVEALANIKGVDGGTIISFAQGLGLMAIAVAGMGLMAIPIAFGAVAAHLLAAAIEPAVAALSGLVGADPGAVSSFAAGLLGIASTVAAIGLMAPLLLLGGIGIALIALPLLAFNKAMAIMPENFDMTGFGEGLKTLAIAGADLIPAAIGIGILAVSLSALAIALVVVTPMMLLFTAALSIIGDKIPIIVEGIVTVLQSIKEVIVVISSEIIRVIGAIQSAVIDIVSNISTAIITTITAIGEVISTTVKNITDEIIKVITAITTGIQLVGNVINSIITNIATSIISVVTTVGNTINSIITNIATSIISVVTTVGNAISTTIANIANEIIKVITAISTGIQTIGTVIVNVITGIASGIAMVVESIAGGISQIVTGIGNAISGIIDSFTGFISTLGSISPSQIFSLAAGFTVLGMAGLAMGVGSIGIIGMSGALGLLALSLGLLAPLMPVIDKLAQFGLLGDVGIESSTTSTSTNESAPEEKEVFDNSILADKLDTLIELMTKGGTVTLDGKKVGQILNNAMGPIGA